GVRDEVTERHALQQAQAAEEPAQLAGGHVVAVVRVVVGDDVDHRGEVLGDLVQHHGAGYGDHQSSTSSASSRASRASLAGRPGGASAGGRARLRPGGTATETT